MAHVILYGKVEEMGGGIDQDAVGPVSQKSRRGHQGQVLPRLPEDTDKAGFGGDIKKTAGGIEGENIGSSAGLES